MKEKAEKKFKQSDVARLVQLAISEAGLGFLEWLKNETEIVDSITKELIDNSEIRIKDKSTKIFPNYVYPRMLKHGIDITYKNMDIDSTETS